MDKYVDAKFKATLDFEEREGLKALVSRGKSSARKLMRARILLLSDEGPEGPGKTDAEIAEVLECGPRTVSRIRKRCVLEGPEKAIESKPQPPRPDKVKIKGKVEDTLVEVACSDPPKGRSHWTLQLLADELIVLGCVETVGREAVRTALKNTALHPGS